MIDHVLVTGMVLKTSPVREYDKRLIILTKERGKITVFANGVRRQGNKNMAAANTFCFGQFKLREGKEAYNLVEAEISYYFDELSKDIGNMFLASYFAEYADYYSRENNDEVEMLKLLFQSVKAIIKPTIDNKLVKVVYELKALCVNGEFPGVPVGRDFQQSTLYAIDFIKTTPIAKLYTFAVTPEVLAELKELSDDYRKKFIDHHFVSLDMLEECML